MKSYYEIFDGKTALITGGAKRIGRAIALELAEHGANVIIHFNKSDGEASETVDNLRRRGSGAYALKANLADPDQAEGLIYRAVDMAGPVDYLVNSASIYPMDNLENLTNTDIEECMRINAYAPLQLCRAFANQKECGAILNMLDARIHSYDREHVAYHISKRSLFTITRMLAYELAPHIRVNGVAPGLILPPVGEGVEWLEKRRHTNLLDSYGTVEDITDASLFLLASDFITGEVIHVDGGRHLKNNFYG